MHFRRSTISIRGNDTAQHLIVRDMKEGKITFENWDPNAACRLPLIQTLTRTEFVRMIKRDDYAVVPTTTTT